MHGVRPADQDRLPWLEPYREANKPGRPLPRRGYGRPLVYGAGLGLLLMVGAGGYWLGQRDEVPSERRPSTTIALPAPKSPPVEIAQVPPPAVEPVATEAELPVAKEPAPVKKRTKRRAPPRKKIRSAGVETDRLNAVRAAQEQKTAQERKPVSRPWPKMPSPGPAGHVIQLGAFTSPVRASNAYYQRVARYKVLAGMPRVVVPVITKPDGRILYVLRLGTNSRQQSRTVCRNLRRSGDHCLVIG